MLDPHGSCTAPEETEIYQRMLIVFLLSKSVRQALTLAGVPLPLVMVNRGAVPAGYSHFWTSAALLSLCL